MIKFLKYVLAYFDNKIKVKPKPQPEVEDTALLPFLPGLTTFNPVSIISIKSKYKYGNGHLMVLGSIADGNFDPQVILTLHNPANADALGKGLAELFVKYGVNVSVEGNLGDRKENVTTNTAVKYMEQV